MSSGSFKDLTKAISSSISNRSFTLPLPEDLLHVIQEYLEKHASHDEADSQRLQEELLSVYQRDIVDKSSRLAPFLAILRALKPGIRGSGRLLQWWDKLAVSVLSKLGEEKGLTLEARDTMLAMLVYDEEGNDELVKDANATSLAVVDNLILTWLAKSTAASAEFDQEAHFVEGQIKLILVLYGKKKPKDFLSAINKFFVNTEHRILILSLLCEFIRHNPPHLHQLLQTPLFENLLKCLQIDTSTRVISLGMTALIMFLPHIPSSLAEHLPALFNIYSRMLFWDRERRAADKTTTDVESDEDEKEKAARPKQDGSWVKLPYILESDDEKVPELLPYFTFLYGLYPINFMSYIRKPQRYLRHANFPGADDLDIQPTEIRERSESFREVHLLHPNFFMMTIESELTDNKRWMKSEAADVVAECMALYSPGDDGHLFLSGTREANKMDANTDVPEQSLLERDGMIPYQSRHTSWRNTQSTAVASPDERRTSGMHRKGSQTSQSMPSIADSPLLHPIDRVDSPTLPPTFLTSPPHTQLQDMLSSHREKSNRGSLYQYLTNDSAASLTLSHQESAAHVDAYLQSLSRETIPRSPSLHATSTSAPTKIAYLYREIQLLRNDLNFERYLKQQHLSHIGQLRRRQIREARVEAETQNLINSNRGLRNKLDEAKRALTQLRKESEKSKSHARKWDADLSSKLKVLREEQKKWALERQELMRDLQTQSEDNDRLRQLVVMSEATELVATQKMQSVEASLDEVERLRGEVEKLTLTIRTYEASESEFISAQEREEAAVARLKLLEMRMSAREAEYVKSVESLEKELISIHNSAAYRAGLAATSSPSSSSPLSTSRSNTAVSRITQDMLDAALSASRNRIAELQKAQKHLVDKYVALQDAYTAVLEVTDRNYEGPDDGDGDTALLDGVGRSVSEGLRREVEEDEGREGKGVGGPAASFRTEGSGSGRGLARMASDADFDISGSPSALYGRTGSPMTRSQTAPLKTNSSALGHGHGHGHLSPVDRALGALNHAVGGYYTGHSAGATGVGSSGNGSVGSGGGGKRIGGGGGMGLDGAESFESAREKNGSASPGVGVGVGLAGEKKKIAAGSDARVYGRGGVQNIGKKEKEKDNQKEKDKDKKEKEKDKSRESQTPDGKKDKKSVGIRGIRGFS